MGNKQFELLIIRKGGVSEKALIETIESDENSEYKNYQISIVTKKHNDFKQETENLEGPGQFLRHYAPNIESFLFDGKI